jgi:ubiquinone/menaquinone biosynthesis C-methylase UbiE
VVDTSDTSLESFFDRFAPQRAAWQRTGYQQLLLHYYRFFVPPGARVLEIGCGLGDLLAGLQPSVGVGIDFSAGMIAQARARHPQPHLQFVQQRAETLALDGEPFDYIILSDTLTFLDDILAAFRQLPALCHPRTRIITNFFSRLWYPVLKGLECLGLRYPQPQPNWVTVEDVRNFLHLAGFETVTTDSRIVCPARIPILDSLLNRVLMVVPGYRQLCLANFVVARLPQTLPADTSVSVICACRNESGNIRSIVERLPAFAGPSELIFVEGNSKDDTFEQCQRVAAEFPDRQISVLRQPGKGKGDAVRHGFAAAKYDVLMILDADMTVPPEDLPGFVTALLSGQAEFVNGSRLVYPMEDQAMRFLNLVGNRFFSLTFSWLLGQPLKDTLCGTKVLLKRDYDKLSAGRSYFGDFDPFGDFDLIFGAAKLGLAIRDYPIRYRARTFGETQISRFRHGWLLLQMAAFATWKLKCR